MIEHTELSAGVLGETALPKFRGLKVRSPSRYGVGGAAEMAILGFTACSHGFGFEFRLGLVNGVELTY